VRSQDSTSTEIHYRLATIADFSLLIEFVREFHEYEHLPFDEQIDSDVLLYFLSHESLGQTWLILYADEAIGYLILTLGFSLEYRGQDAFIDEFYLRPSYRGQGIGTQTLAFVENTCLDLDIKAIHLEVDVDNSHAQQLYRRAGYQSHDRFLLTKNLMVGF
jgi:GNAT superfamily N-acetyltransferase